MKLTNRMGLPDAIVSAVQNDGYTKEGADFSVTGLLSPPRKAVLEAKHGDELTEDASDRIWSLMGQSIHTILERASGSAGIAERRLSAVRQGVTVSGGMDAYYPASGLLQDYKTTSVYKLLGDGVPREWEEQLNLYALLLRQNGDGIETLQVVAILRDWSKMEARRNPDYPQCQVATVPIPLWPAEKAERFLNDRITLHLQARVTLPLCTSEERWERPTKYAVMKKGGKRALKLHESEASAKDHVSNASDLFVEKRPGESIRCSAYCSVSSVCSQYQETLNHDEKENES